jgi:hypothetical protein
VNLAVAEEVPAFAASLHEGLRVAAEGPDRLRKRHAVPVLETQESLFEGAGVDGAAEKGRAEAEALLVGEGDDLERVVAQELAPLQDGGRRVSRLDPSPEFIVLWYSGPEPRVSDAKRSHRYFWRIFGVEW